MRYKTLEKKGEIVEKIAKGKLNKFISDNTLLNQIWILDPQKKVSDILREKKEFRDQNRRLYKI